MCIVLPDHRKKFVQIGATENRMIFFVNLYGHRLLPFFSFNLQHAQTLGRSQAEAVLPHRLAGLVMRVVLGNP